MCVFNVCVCFGLVRLALFLFLVSGLFALFGSEPSVVYLFCLLVGMGIKIGAVGSLMFLIKLTFLH